VDYTDEDFDRQMAPEEPWFVESWDTEQWKRDEDLGTYTEKPKGFDWLRPAPGVKPLGRNELFVNMGEPGN
jgi:hypothetical protein